VLGAPPPALLAAFARRSQHAVGLRLAPRRGSGLAALAPRLAPAGLDLLGRLLSYDPAARPSAEQALRHPYFRALRRAPALRPSPPRGRARARPGVQRPGAACLATLMAASQTQHARQARSSAPGWRRTAAPERRAASRLRAHAEWRAGGRDEASELRAATAAPALALRPAASPAAAPPLSGRRSAAALPAGAAGAGAAAAPASEAGTGEGSATSAAPSARRQRRWAQRGAGALRDPAPVHGAPAPHMHCCSPAHALCAVLSVVDGRLSRGGRGAGRSAASARQAPAFAAPRLPPALAAAAERRARILQRAPAAAAPARPYRRPAGLQRAARASESGFAAHLRSRPAAGLAECVPGAGPRAGLARGRPGAYASPYSLQALQRGGVPPGRVRR